MRTPHAFIRQTSDTAKSKGPGFSFGFSIGKAVVNPNGAAAKPNGAGFSFGFSIGPAADADARDVSRDVSGTENGHGYKRRRME